MKKTRIFKMMIWVSVFMMLCSSILPTGKICYAVNETNLSKNALKKVLSKFDLKDKTGGNNVHFDENSKDVAFSFLRSDEDMQFSINENGNLVITTQIGDDEYGGITILDTPVQVEISDFKLTDIYADDFVDYYNSDPTNYKPYDLFFSNVKSEDDTIMVFFHLGGREYPLEEGFSISKHPLVLTEVGVELTDSAGRSTGNVKDMGGNLGVDAYIPDEEAAGFLERLISAFIRSTSLGYYALIRLIMGSGVSIETLIFNKFNNTKLTLFEDMGDSNTYIVEIREVLNEFFKIGRNIAIIAYMIILIYMGIRIMLNAGAQKKAQFKELFMYWVQGIAILFLFPYVIKYTIVLNDLFVEYVYQARNNMEFYQGFQQPETGDVLEGEGIAQIADGMIKSSQELMDRVKANNEKEKTDYMAAIYQYAADYGWITYSICFAVIIKEWLSLLVTYFKRLITVIFLIAIFPFVSISYAIDKIGDGKSQAFSNWYKEFALNVFLQSFHVIVYVVCISLIITAAEISHRNPNENWLLILITLTFLGNGEDLLKSIFHMKGGGGATVKNTATTLLALKGAQDIVNNSRKAISNKFGAQSNFGKFRRGIGNMAADRVNSALNNSQQKANMIMASKVEERT